MTSQFYLEPTSVERKRVYAPNLTQNIVVTKIDANVVPFNSQNQVPSKKRVDGLVRYRNITGLLSFLLLAVLLAFPFFGLPYEPIMAILLAVFGIFVVFVMKVAEAA